MYFWEHLCMACALASVLVNVPSSYWPVSAASLLFSATWALSMWMSEQTSWTAFRWLQGEVLTNRNFLRFHSFSPSSLKHLGSAENQVPDVKIFSLCLMGLKLSSDHSPAFRMQFLLWSAVLSNPEQFQCSTDPRWPQVSHVLAVWQRESRGGKNFEDEEEKDHILLPSGFVQKNKQPGTWENRQKCASKRRKSIPLALMYDSDGMYFCDRTQSLHAFVCFNTVFLVFTNPFEKKANIYHRTEQKPWKCMLDL